MQMNPIKYLRVRMTFDRDYVRRVTLIWSGLAFIFFTAFFGFLLMMFPTVFLLGLFNLDFYFKVADTLMMTWLYGAVFVLEDLWGINFMFYSSGDDGDEDTDDRLKLVLCNHPTNFDWMYLWVWLTELVHHPESPLFIDRGNRNVLKSSLKHIPAFGWALQCCGSLFLERNWSKDRDNICTILELYRTLPLNSTILLFPEGTNLSEEAKKKSDEFARKNGMTPMIHCLVPRSKGLTAILDEIANEITTVYDLTISFMGDYPQTPSDLFFYAKLPRAVCFFQHVVNIKLIDPASHEQWIRKVWQEKDKLLDNFYRSNNFGNRVQKVLSLANALTRRVVFIFWVTVLSIVVFLTFTSIRFILYIVGAVMTTVFISLTFGGITEFLLRVHRRNINTRLEDTFHTESSSSRLQEVAVSHDCECSSL